MFLDNPRLSKLIEELKTVRCLRDDSLEYSVQSNGALQVTGFLYVRCRTIVAISHRSEKSTAICFDKDSNSVKLQFQDNNEWTVPGGVGTKQAQIPNDIVSYVTEQLPGIHPVEQTKNISGSTRLIRCNITTRSQMLKPDVIQNILATPTVIDVVAYSTHFDIMLARPSNVVGALAQIGTTTGFRAVRRVSPLRLCAYKRARKHGVRSANWRNILFRFFDR